MRYCEDCSQDKPYDPNAPARTKANGFYGWHCWDCHKQEALGRLHKRTGVQSPEYIALKAQLEALNAEVLQVKSAMFKLHAGTAQAIKEARQQAQKVARKARPKALPKNMQVTANGARIIVMSLPYGELVTEARITLAQFLQEFPADHKDFAVRKQNLEYKLEYAQNKLNRFGPDAYDFRSAERNKEVSHE